MHYRSGVHTLVLYIPIMPTNAEYANYQTISPPTGANALLDEGYDRKTWGSTFVLSPRIFNLFSPDRCVRCRLCNGLDLGVVLKLTATVGARDSSPCFHLQSLTVSSQHSHQQTPLCPRSELVKLKRSSHCSWTSAGTVHICNSAT